jgi:hypothetical protein
MTRSAHVLLVLAALSLAPACAEFESGRRMRALAGKNERITPAGRGTLVVASHAGMARLGFIALETGSRHVIEFEHSPHADAGFAGPDERGRFAYFTGGQSLARIQPTSLDATLFGPDVLRPSADSGRSKRYRSKDSLARAVFEPRSLRLRAGEIGGAGERLVAEFDPADVLEKALALAPSSGELAYFAFDFDAEGVPIGLRLEVRSLAGGAPRRFPLGRPQIESHGLYGPSLAWLADEHHLVFKRDRAEPPGDYELAADWNGNKRVLPGLAASSAGTRAHLPWRPDRKDVVICALDARTGAVRELASALYAWPIGGSDGVLASDGDALWIVHAATGEIEGRRELAHDSPLRAPWSGADESKLAIVAAPAEDRVFARCRAGADAGIARDWATTLKTGPTEFGLGVTTLDGAPVREVVPILTEGALGFARGNLPADLPALVRSAKHSYD